MTDQASHGLPRVLSLGARFFELSQVIDCQGMLTSQLDQTVVVGVDKRLAPQRVGRLFSKPIWNEHWAVSQHEPRAAILVQRRARKGFKFALAKKRHVSGVKIGESKYPRSSSERSTDPDFFLCSNSAQLITE